MLIEGKIWQDGKHWIAEVSMLDAATQGATRKQALGMIEDLLRTMAKEEINQRINFKVGQCENDHFAVKPSKADYIPALILKRMRMKNEQTVQDVVDRLGEKSKNAYAAYEQGRHIPGLFKWQELLSAICPKTEMVLKIV